MNIDTQKLREWEQTDEFISLCNSIEKDTGYFNYTASITNLIEKIVNRIESRHQEEMKKVCEQIKQLTEFVKGLHI